MELQLFAVADARVQENFEQGGDVDSLVAELIAAPERPSARPSFARILSQAFPTADITYIGDEAAYIAYESVSHGSEAANGFSMAQGSSVRFFDPLSYTEIFSASELEEDFDEADPSSDDDAKLARLREAFDELCSAATSDGSSCGRASTRIRSPYAVERVAHEGEFVGGLAISKPDRAAGGTFWVVTKIVPATTWKEAQGGAMKDIDIQSVDDDSWHVPTVVKQISRRYFEFEFGGSSESFKSNVADARQAIRAWCSTFA